MGKKVDQSSVSKNNLYYLNAFKKIDEGKIAWNWAAFFFQSFWMIYRKMYVYALFFLVLDALVLYFLRDLGEFSFHVCMLVYKSLYGCIGNVLYKRIVNERITEGYHLMENYKTTALALSCLGVVFSIVNLARKYFHIGVDSYTWLVAWPVIPAIALIFFILWCYMEDSESNKQYYAELERKDNEWNDENVLKYLAQDKKTLMTANGGDIWCLTLIVIILACLVVDIREEQSKLLNLIDSQNWLIVICGIIIGLLL